MKHLGIDYGSKKIGLAISDIEAKMAFPYKIIENNISSINEITSICKKENVSAIVLGESNDLKGKPNKIMGSIETFKKNIETESGLPIYFEKEFFTTIEARGREGKSVLNSRKIKKEQTKKVDSSAAALILSRYLDKKNLK